MAAELIRPVNYYPGSSQKLIKLEISSCRCSQLEYNENNDETGLYTPLLPLTQIISVDLLKGREFDPGPVPYFRVD